MRVLVIGYGGIGERHTRVLASMGHEVGILSRRPVDHPYGHRDLAEALTQFGPSYAVIANETAAHRSTLEALRARGFGGAVLVEKPLFQFFPPADAPAPGRVFVGYNLRFHPVLLRMRRWLAGRRPISASLHVGRYLPSIRPGLDYRQRPAAQRAKGGGVLRELSHELDYALWLFGPWRRVTALGGRSGALDIDADDRWSIVMETDRCPQVSVGLSFIDHARRRQIHVNAADASAAADLDELTFAASDFDGVERFAIEREASYRAQHAAILSGEAAQACTYTEGLAVVGLIAAIEQASAQRRWVSNPA